MVQILWWVRGRVGPRLVLVLASVVIFLTCLVLAFAQYPDGTNHIRLSIACERNGPKIDEVRLSIRLPDWMTNSLDIYSFDPTDEHPFHGIESPWQLAATNLQAHGASEVVWKDEGQCGRPAISECRSRYYVAGNADIDTDGDGEPDARELFIHKTNPLFVDSDQDGADDEWEAAQSFSPDNPDDAWQDDDGDGFPNVYEYAHRTNPHNRNSVPSVMLHVSEHGSTLGDGTEVNPFGVIQTAINAARDFDIVLIQPGVYTGELNRNLDFLGKPIMVMSSSGAATCVIDCRGSGRGVWFSRGEDRRTVLRGVTIRNGAAEDGAGIRCETSRPTIEECVIESNAGDGIVFEFSEALLSGCVVQNNSNSGIAFLETCDVLVTNCAITRNAEYGVVCHDETSPTFVGSSIADNGLDGASLWGRSDAVFMACDISRNSDVGILVGDESSPRIERCGIAYNEYGIVIDGLCSGDSKGEGPKLVETTIRCNAYDGVASYCASPSFTSCLIEENDTGINAAWSDLLVDGCLIRGNGTGLYDYSSQNSLIQNCQVLDNDGNGMEFVTAVVVVKNTMLRGNGWSGIDFWNASRDVVVENCTMVGNSAGITMGDAYLSARNCVLWGNGGYAVEVYSGSPVITYCCVEGGWDGVGNIAADPLLTPMSFRLTSESPCIDAGIDMGLDWDIDGESGWDHPHHSNTASFVDIGADEFVDSDLDGMADLWEMEHFASLSRDGTDDCDRGGGPDGLTALQEYCAATDPEMADTDGDLLLDGEEVNLAGTDPLNADSDGDLLYDGSEVAAGLDPVNSTDVPLTWLLADDDGDGFLNAYELNKHTDPGSPDSSPAIDLYVRSDAPDGGDGSTERPYNQIQDALDAACPYGIVSVASGHYRGSRNRGLSFKGKALLLTSEDGPSQCVIDCEGADAGILFENDEDARSSIKGFTIRNAGGPWGAGVVCRAKNPRIEACVIVDNQSSGITILNGHPLVANCFIARNGNKQSKGGIFCQTTSSNTSRVDNCTIVGNAGGGMRCGYNPRVSLQNCILWTNTPSQFTVDSTYADPVIAATYCCIQEGRVGVGNIGSDPQLVRDSWRLKSTSPCIDAGISEGVMADMDGEAFWDHPSCPNFMSAVDIGADEFVDVDLDQMADVWELEHFGTVSQEGNADEDSCGGPDGLSDSQEYEYNTDPFKADTDDDGLSDGQEILAFMTNPRNRDTDGDMMSDGWEVATGLDPRICLCREGASSSAFYEVVQDQDDDGYPKLYEMIHGTDPMDVSSQPSPTVFVDVNADTGGSGSLENPFKDIQSAIDAAGYCDIINVQAGTYSGRRNVNLNLLGKPIIIEAPGGCVLDCGEESCGFLFASGEDERCIVRGFTVVGAQLGVRCEGTSAPQIQNCTIIENAVSGAATYGQSTPSFENCTIAGNRESGLAVYASYSPGLRNCILWGNNIEQIEYSVASPFADHCCVQDGWQGVGIVTNDPALTPCTYRLTAASPCIDMGTTNAAFGRMNPRRDRDGEERVLIHSDRISDVDIGADEFVDYDGDDVPDLWELQSFNHLCFDGDGDCDEDGLADVLEYEYDTNPHMSDTDGDGLLDGEEINNIGTDPNEADSDGDGLGDLEDQGPLHNPDSDRDRLPDVWELSNFGDLDQTAFTDFDGDWLADGEELLFSTDPCSLDVDGDGVPDLQEATMAFSDPYFCDFDGTFSNLAVLAGNSTLSRVGCWVAAGDDSIYCKSRHGWLEYEMSVLNDGFYAVSLDLGQHSSNASKSPLDIEVAADGVEAGRQYVCVSNSAITSPRFFLPFMKSGMHTLRVRWHYAPPCNELQVFAVRLESVGGPDADGNERCDWIDNRIERLISLPAATNSFVSPACVVGRSPAVHLLSASNQTASGWNDLPLCRGVNGSWYANVPLADANPAVVGVSADSCAARKECAISWTPLNVFQCTRKSISIRRNDTLLLTAIPPGMSDGLMSIAVSQGTNHVSETAEPIAVTFSEEGAFSVSGQYSSGALSVVTTLEIRVVSGTVPEDPACQVDGYCRDWYWPEWTQHVSSLDSDLLLGFADQGMLSGGVRLFQLRKSDSKDSVIVVQAGVEGPIVTGIQVKAFSCYSTRQTYTEYLHVYENGDRLVETLIVLDPVLTELVARLKIFVGGVVFEDGTFERELTHTDFNELGEYRVRMILPAGCRTAICHVLLIYQDGLLIGGR